jgi:hypothetical protein
METSYSIINVVLVDAQPVTLPSEKSTTSTYPPVEVIERGPASTTTVLRIGAHILASLICPMGTSTW